MIRTLETLSDRLTHAKIPHLCYHGDLETAARKRIQSLFMNGENQLVLATNAFGMGIDKESIRYVMHAEIPGSLESYYQEIGRAGRDGKEAFCHLLYDEQDLLIQMDFIKWNNPGADFYQRVYDILLDDLEKANALGIEWMKERLLFKNRTDFRLETALGMLDRFGVVSGSIEQKNLQIVDGLPDLLSDEDYLAEKLQREQKKLYTMVQYAKTTDNRKAFIHNYFGLPFREAA